MSACPLKAEKEEEQAYPSGMTGNIERGLVSVPAVDDRRSKRERRRTSRKARLTSSVVPGLGAPSDLGGLGVTDGVSRLVRSPEAATSSKHTRVKSMTKIAQGQRALFAWT
jgi:hypothetical protein